MKITTVTLRNQGVSPKKARLVIDVIRNKDVSEAITIVENLPKVSAPLVLHLLKSAVSNAKSKDYQIEELYVSESLCQEGRRLKRHFVRARGRSTKYFKRYSHLKISLSKKEETVNKEIVTKGKKPGKVENGTKS